MRWVRRSALAGLASLGLALAARARAEPPPLSAYGALPAVEEMTLSPDGKAFAFVGTDEGGKRRVFVRSADGALLRAIDLGSQKAELLAWAGDTHLLVFSRRTLHQHALNGGRLEMTSVVSLNVLTGGYLELLTAHGLSLGDVLRYDGAAEVGGRWMAFLLSQDGGGERLYRVDVDSGEGQAIADVDRETYAWTIDGRGAVAARAGFDSYTKLWSLYPGLHGAKPVFSRTSANAELSLGGLGRRPGTVLVRDRSGDADQLLEVALQGDAPPAVVSGGADGEDTVYSREDRLLIGLSYPLHARLDAFDPALKRSWDAARRPFAKYRTTLVSTDGAFDRMILRTTGAGESGTYWLVDVAAGKASSLAQAYPAIGPDAVAATRMVRYKAGDGLEIEAVLTSPLGRPLKDAPLVVMPHGGPSGVYDDESFDWLAQAFASRGYAVLQPNFRGSGGYGGAFQRAGDGQWGLKMQSDLSDGVAWLAGQGLVDPRRVCIVGASYGGYAALAGVTLQHGVYRCAVSYAGVSDLGAELWQVGHNRDSVAARREERALGASWSGDATLADRSPVRQAARADAPILLIHGKDDTVVPLQQSQAMDAALTQAGKPHQLVQLDGEDHWLSTAKTRQEMLQAAVGFVLTEDPPG